MSSQSWSKRHLLNDRISVHRQQQNKIKHNKRQDKKTTKLTWGNAHNNIIILSSTNNIYNITDLPFYIYSFVVLIITMTSS